MPLRNEKDKSPGLTFDLLALRRKYQLAALLGDEEVAEGYVAALVDTLSPCPPDTCELKYIPKSNFRRVAPERAVEFQFGAFTCVKCSRLRPATREEQAEYHRVDKRKHRGKYETFERYERRMKER